MQTSDYTTNQITATHVLTAWSFSAGTNCATTVLPDGCQDFIVRYPAQGEPEWFVSDLSQDAYTVTTQEGTQFSGLRLRPGTRIDSSALSRWLADHNPHTLFNTDQIDEFCYRSPALTEALDCLASGMPNVKTTAKALGVSTRSLQRFVKDQTGFPPRFWWSLARARRAGRSLPDFISLAEAAGVFGFADQAHMTRDIRKWFGTTPKQLRADQTLLALLHDTGYG